MIGEIGKVGKENRQNLVRLEALGKMETRRVLRLGLRLMHHRPANDLAQSVRRVLCYGIRGVALMRCRILG
jgi:hypothetical protein